MPLLHSEVPKALKDHLSSGPLHRLQKVYPLARPERKVRTDANTTYLLIFRSNIFLILQSHPLPAPVASASTSAPKPLAQHLSAPCALPDFKKSTQEVVGILDKKVSTTIERFQAIFDKKHLFEKLDLEHQNSLHQFADQLNWVSDNFDKASTWSTQHREEISWACHCVGTVEFLTPKELLVHRYQKVAKDLVHIANRGYLDWIIL